MNKSSESVTEILLFPLKLVAITLFIDFYLYWFHVAYHRVPWLKAIHREHHDRFKENGIFNLHPAEFIINFIPGAYFVAWIIGWWFVPVVTLWAVFEAARGHGHFRWFKIPKTYYRALQYCGIRYHLYHHEVDESKNLGQMLKVWDKIMGTSYKLG